MIYLEKNEYGVISLDDSYIHQIIKDSIRPFGEKVHIFEYKDSQANYLKYFTINNDYQKLSFSFENDEIYLRIPLVVSLGQSLSTVANSMISAISDSIINDLQLDIKNIDIVITAVHTNKAFSKRNLVFSYKKDE